MSNYYNGKEITKKIKEIDKKNQTINYYKKMQKDIKDFYEDKNNIFEGTSYLQRYKTINIEMYLKPTLRVMIYSSIIGFIFSTLCTFAGFESVTNKEFSYYYIVFIIICVLLIFMTYYFNKEIILKNDILYNYEKNIIIEHLKKFDVEIK